MTRTEQALKQQVRLSKELEFKMAARGLHAYKVALLIQEPGWDFRGLNKADMAAHYAKGAISQRSLERIRTAPRA